MRRALLIAALVALAAAAAHADIRQLMKARGYSMSGSGGACMGSCNTTPGPEAVDIVTQPPLDAGCAFPATFPCTMG